MMGKLRSLKQVLRQWNEEVFGNIDTKIAAAKDSLAAIQKDVYEMGDSDSLMDSEVEATVELNQCLAQQHAFFAQKNRNSWLRDGDRNTAFFHRIHRIRKAREGINTPNVDGVVTIDLNAISEHIVRFYSDLFNASNRETPDFALGYFECSRGVRQGYPLSPLLFCIAEEVLARCLDSAVLNLELRTAMASSRLVYPSYLLYADDVLIFCTDSRANIRRLKGILDQYAIVSGQVFNPAKTKAYFGSLPWACITSSVWRGIRPHTLNIQGGARWILGRISVVRFWLDNWMDFVIADRIGIPHFARAFLTHPVSDYYIDGSWHLDKFFVMKHLDIVE
ncbi:hypothetical protein ACS0TY_026136 [Phlomoides rotata]